ncbi:MAG: dihydrodipicolinate synthase family protein [Synergistaceae bacterium]|jgi:4-hydroxy-tetrahydrodipicolinate synthase|nr:dihydrodipicolinate synthase family protein [Synergistaceae bacterium]
MLSTETRGVFPISPTPFLPDGAIDFASIARLCRFYKNVGVAGITILGLLGEATKLDCDETDAVIREFVQHSGGLEIIVGASSPGFASMRRTALNAMAAGAGGVQIAPPSHLRSDAQIIEYFDCVARTLGSGVPFVIQDYPLVHQVVFTPNVLREIVNRNESCVAIKNEDWPGMDKLRTLNQFKREGSMRNIPIFGGNGGLSLDCEYAAGASGAMTGYPFPEFLVEGLKLVESGKRSEFQDLYDAHLPYLRYEGQPKIGIAIRKYVLCKRGLIAHAAQREPVAALSAGTKDDVDFLLGRLIRKTGLQLEVSSF